MKNTQKGLKSLTVSCMIGNGLEWYDFMLFTQFLTFIGGCVLPPGEVSQVLHTGFWMFFLGFITRPIGALLFGYIGDMHSRGKALLWSIYAMTFATVGIGLLPSYQQWGLGSVALLMLCRSIQGLAMGGEFSGSMIAVVESAPVKERGFWGSLVALSALLGLLMGCAVCWILGKCLTTPELRMWGWRLPFLLSAVGGLVGMVLRGKLGLIHSASSISLDSIDPCVTAITSPAFPIAHEPKETSMASIAVQQPLPAATIFKRWVTLLRCHGHAVWQVVQVDTIVAVGFFLITAYVFNYLLHAGTIPYITLVWMNGLSMGLFALVIPIAGWLSDRYGASPVMIGGCMMLAIMAVPCFMCLNSAEKYIVLMGQMILSGAMGLVFGPLPKLLVCFFPKNIRYTALSVSHNLTMSFLGGITPVLATYSATWSRWAPMPSILLVIAALISVKALIKYKKKRNLVSLYQKIPQETRLSQGAVS